MLISPPLSPRTSVAFAEVLLQSQTLLCLCKIVVFKVGAPDNGLNPSLICWQSLPSSGALMSAWCCCQWRVQATGDCSHREPQGDGL